MILLLGICGLPAKRISSQIKIGVIAELTGDVPGRGASLQKCGQRWPYRKVR